MSDVKFTPGPWVIDPCTRPAEVCTIHHTSHENGFVYVRGELGYWGADKEENMANAHLIAAAPDMYEALNKIINRLQMDIDDGSRPDEWSMKALVKYAKEAQPKAKGETQ